jgi:hypothetical protein
MKLVTFSMAAIEQTKGFARIVENTPTPVANGVGVASGATGIALYADLARHLTTIVGLAVALLALAGATFYAAYWGLKMLQQWRIVRSPVPVKKADEPAGD